MVAPWTFGEAVCFLILHSSLCFVEYGQAPEASLPLACRSCAWQNEAVAELLRDLIQEKEETQPKRRAPHTSSESWFPIIPCFVPDISLNLGGPMAPSILAGPGSCLPIGGVQEAQSQPLLPPEDIPLLRAIPELRKCACPRFLLWLLVSGTKLNNYFMEMWKPCRGTRTHHFALVLLKSPCLTLMNRGHRSSWSLWWDSKWLVRVLDSIFQSLSYLASSTCACVWYCPGTCSPKGCPGRLQSTDGPGLDLRAL